MRAAVPVLVSSLVFATLIFDALEMANRNSSIFPSNSEHMLSSNSQPQANLPRQPLLHRGTGRRSMIENTVNA